MSEPNTKANLKLSKLVLSGLFLALALILPFFTGQIPQIGKMLTPMHFPVILCGFICGPWYGLAVGAIAPLMRSVLFGVPEMMPAGVAMTFELAAYGLAIGLLYRMLPKKKIFVYVSLLFSMIAGRLVWAGIRAILYGLGLSEFGWQLFLAGAFLNAVPGIILQVILIPLIVFALEKRYDFRCL